MTKAELIELLNEWPDDVDIFVASDEEGNRITRLGGYGEFLTDEPGAYRLDDTSYFGADDEEYIAELEEDEVDMSRYKKVLVLYP